MPRRRGTCPGWSSKCAPGTSSATKNDPMARTGTQAATPTSGAADRRHKSHRPMDEAPTVRQLEPHEEAKSHGDMREAGRHEERGDGRFRHDVPSIVGYTDAPVTNARNIHAIFSC